MFEQEKKRRIRVIFKFNTKNWLIFVPSFFLFFFFFYLYRVATRKKIENTSIIFQYRSFFFPILPGLSIVFEEIKMIMCAYISSIKGKNSNTFWHQHETVPSTCIKRYNKH